MVKAMLATATLVLGLTGVACGGGDGVDCTSNNATKLTGTLTIEGFAFHPDCFTVASRSTISMENKDGVGHNFTVRGTNVAVPVPGGGTSEATAPSPGTYDFLCTIHPSMKGTIVVT